MQNKVFGKYEPIYVPQGASFREINNNRNINKNIIKSRTKKVQKMEDKTIQMDDIKDIEDTEPKEEFFQII